MACPFFMPTERMPESPWAHPGRLPLGDSWTGHCTVPGHENDQLTSAELRHCNVGYAAKYCPRLPADRSCDAVRFGVLPSQHDDSSPGAANESEPVTVQYVCEIGYAPGEVGTLTFEPLRREWTTRHPDPRIQKMAECYLSAALARRGLQP